jgi:hypothetical protein
VIEGEQAQNERTAVSGEFNISLIGAAETAMSDDEMFVFLQQKTFDNLQTLSIDKIFELLSLIASYTGWNKLPGSEKRLITKIGWLQEQIDTNELVERKKAVFRECIRIYEEVDVIQKQIATNFTADTSPVDTEKTLVDAIAKLEMRTLAPGHEDEQYLQQNTTKDQVVNQINNTWQAIIDLLRSLRPETYDVELKRLIEVTNGWLHDAGVLSADESFMSLSLVAVADSSDAKKKLAELAIKIKHNFPDSIIK